MNTSQLGNIGESRVLCEFVKNEIPCFLPYGDGNTVDLVAYFHNRLNKIQIKTTEKRNSSGAMEWKVSHQEGFHGNRVSYSLDDIDYFAFYCLETDTVCLVPFDKDFPKSTLSIRPDDYKGRHIAGMRFASDYSIKTIALK